MLADDQERTLPISLNPEKTWIWWTLGAVAVVGGASRSATSSSTAARDPLPGHARRGLRRGYGATGFHF